METTSAPSAFGRQLRQWRRLRGISQLELANEAELSQRHLSFIETGRSRPGPDVVRRIGDALGIPLRERNRLLESAGLSPAYPELPLEAAAVAPFRAAIDRMLQTHEPYPAYVIDRWWNIVDTNQAGRLLFPYDLANGINGVDAFLAPGPMREILDNFAEVAWAFVDRLRQEVMEAGMDERLTELLERAHDHLADVPRPDGVPGPDLVICPRLNIEGHQVSTISMVARFGNAREITVDELRVELIYPADESAEQFFRALPSGSQNAAP